MDGTRMTRRRVVVISSALVGATLGRSLPQWTSSFGGMAERAAMQRRLKLRQDECVGLLKRALGDEWVDGAARADVAHVVEESFLWRHVDPRVQTLSVELDELLESWIGIPIDPEDGRVTAIDRTLSSVRERIMTARSRFDSGSLDMVDTMWALFEVRALEQIVQREASRRARSEPCE